MVAQSNICTSHLQVRGLNFRVAFYDHVCHTREWKIFLVDLRNHGNSTKLPGFQAPHTLQAAADDLLQFTKSKIG